MYTVCAGDNASMGYATINCPQNSDYDEAEAPCIIDAEGDNVMATNMQINTINGSPADFVFRGSAGGDFTGSVLTCDAGTSVINGYTFENEGDCYVTSPPTLSATHSPTIIPTASTTTLHPSVNPTASPLLTSYQTTNPTVYSTTLVPTLFGEIEAAETTETIKIESTGDVQSDVDDAPNILLYILIFAAPIISVICIWRCILIVNKQKHRIKSKYGEPARHSIVSQDLAKSDDENVETFEYEYDDDDDFELPLEIHLCMQTSDGTEEGQMLPAPELEEQLTQEEVIEIKRNYEKQKSTLSMVEMGNYGKNVLMDIKLRDLYEVEMEREDSESEELYDAKHGQQATLTLTRDDTPKSDGVDTSHSGRPTKR